MECGECATNLEGNSQLKDDKRFYEINIDFEEKPQMADIK